MNPLVRLDPGLFIWTIITFVVLLVVMRSFAWKKILHAIERRERAIRDAIESAKKEREEAQHMLEEHRRMIEQARRDTARMIEQGRKDGEAARAEMIEKARRQVSRTQMRGSFRCAVTGPHVPDRKCKPRTTGGSAANCRIHTSRRLG